jgi:hypothetical protein
MEPGRAGVPASTLWAKFSARAVDAAPTAGGDCKAEEVQRMKRERTWSRVVEPPGIRVGAGSLKTHPTREEANADRDAKLRQGRHCWVDCVDDRGAIIPTP